MSKKNSPKRLVLFKQTIAHLDHGQMDSARGGQVITTGSTITCPITQGDSYDPQKDYTQYCTVLKCE